MQIVSVKRISNQSKRYDLQTKNTHAFYANGILVHNSIIKVWYDGPECWHVSTNGMIDAFETDLQLPTDELKSFGDIFMKAWNRSPYSNGDLIDAFGGREDITFIFELVSPWNRVVVPYADIDIYLIGARNNKTGEEIDPDTLGYHFKRPKVYSFGTFEEAVANAAALPFSQEGYVVVDKDWHRVKVKSKAYLQAHHLKDNGNVNPKRVLELIKANEQDEFLNYFPEYDEHFRKVQDRYEDTMVEIFSLNEKVETLKKTCPTRKEFALEALKASPKLRKYYFAMYDGDAEKVKQMIADLSYDDLI